MPSGGASLTPPWTVTITLRNVPTGARAQLVVTSPTGDKRHTFELTVPAGPGPWATAIQIAGMPSGSVANLTLFDGAGSVASTSSTTLP